MTPEELMDIGLTVIGSTYDGSLQQLRADGHLITSNIEQAIAGLLILAAMKGAYLGKGIQPDDETMMKAAKMMVERVNQVTSKKRS